MNAHPVLLQKKYARIVALFAKKGCISLDKALDLFYHSNVYSLMKDGISDFHCRSDEYLADELINEFDLKTEF